MLHGHAIVSQDGAIAVIEIALEVRHVCFEFLEREARSQSRLYVHAQDRHFLKWQLLVVNDPFAAILKNLDVSDQGLGDIELATRGEARIRTGHDAASPIVHPVVGLL